MDSGASSGARSPRWHTGRMANDDAQDPKERYRQALERKKAQAGHHGQSHTASGGAAKGSTAKAGGKREFRRKSG